VAELLRENCPISSRALDGNAFGTVMFRDQLVSSYVRTNKSEFGDTAQIAPFVVLCATYAFSFTHRVRKTTVLYNLVRIDPTHPGAAFVIDRAAGDVPVEHLHLSHMGSFAE
jgi:hypothetical protein